MNETKESTTTPILYALLRPNAVGGFVSMFQKLDTIQLRHLQFFNLLPLLPAVVEDLDPTSLTFSAASQRLAKMPYFREVQYKPDEVVCETSLILEMPVIVLILAEVAPQWLGYLAIKKPFVVITLDPGLYSYTRQIPNVYSVLFEGIGAISSIYQALSSLLGQLAYRHNAHPSMQKLIPYLKGNEIFIQRPRLDFIEPIVLPPPDLGRPACFLLGRLANNFEFIAFEDNINQVRATTHLEWIKLAAVAFTLIEKGIEIPETSGISTEHITDALDMFNATQDNASKLEIVLAIGRKLNEGKQRGVSFFTIPSLNLASVKEGLPESFIGRHIDHQHRRAIIRAVRRFCSKTDDILDSDKTKQEIDESVRGGLAAELEMLASQTTLLAGRLFALPFMLHPFVSQHYVEMRELQDNLLDKKSSKAGQRFRKFQNSLAQSLPAEILAQMLDHGNELVLYSDLPFEWILAGDVPICFLKPTSRIPISFTRWSTVHAVMESSSKITVSNSSKTLVLNMVAEHDSVRPYSESLKRNLAEKGIHLTHVQVRSAQDVQDALRRHQPEVVFLDAHGKYDATLDKLFLFAFDTPIDVEIFLGNSIVPKVWILSACETTMTDALRGCFARQLLARGAACVIGTLSRVDARLAMLFFTELFTEIYIGNNSVKSLTLDQAFRRTQIYISSFFEPLLPLIRRGQTEIAIRPQLELVMDDIGLWMSTSTSNLSTHEYFATAKEKLDTSLERHGLLDMYRNLEKAGRAFPETLLFNCFGFAKGVKLYRDE